MHIRFFFFLIFQEFEKVTFDRWRHVCTFQYKSDHSSNFSNDSQIASQISGTPWCPLKRKKKKVVVLICTAALKILYSILILKVTSEYFL